MNVRLFGLAAAMTVAMGAVACGDDTSTGSGGAAGTGGGSSTGTDATASTGTGSGSTSSTSSSSPTSSSSGGDGGEGGGGVTSTGTGGEGGAPPVEAPCQAECADDAGCALTPADPETAECGDCVSEQAANVAECATNATFGDECGADEACAAYRDCYLDNLGDEEGQAQCGVDNPDGAAKARALVLEGCGACGNGDIE